MVGANAIACFSTSSIADSTAAFNCEWSWIVAAGIDVVTSTTYAATGFASAATARPIAATTRVFIGVLLSCTRGPSPATAGKSAYAGPLRGRPALMTRLNLLRLNRFRRAARASCIRFVGTPSTRGGTSPSSRLEPVENDHRADDECGIQDDSGDRDEVAHDAGSTISSAK